MDIRKAQDERTGIIAKSNALIQQSRYELGAQEQKILLYLISRVDSRADELPELEVDLADICKVCGVQSKGNNYAKFKQTLKKLSDRSFWISDGKTDLLFRWINDVELRYNETCVKVTFGKYLETYLLHLKKNFTAYELEYVLAMQSKYSIRFYEIFKSYSYQEGFEASLSELRMMLNADGYNDSCTNFRNRVIEPAVNEVNELTELEVSYEMVKKGKKFETVRFEIKPKAIEPQIESMIKRGRILERNDELNAN